MSRQLLAPAARLRPTDACDRPPSRLATLAAVWCTLCLLEYDIFAAVASRRSAMRGYVALANVCERRREQPEPCRVEDLHVLLIEARASQTNILILSWERFSRTSFDRIHCRPAPSITGRLPDDSPREVHARLCGDDVRAGLEVRA